MEQKILGFSGRKQSGKNTCANVIFGWDVLDWILIYLFLCNKIISNFEDGKSTLDALYFCISIPRAICSFAIPIFAAWEPDLLLFSASI